MGWEGDCGFGWKLGTRHPSPMERYWKVYCSTGRSWLTHFDLQEVLWWPVDLLEGLRAGFRNVLHGGRGARGAEEEGGERAKKETGQAENRM